MKIANLHLFPATGKAENQFVGIKIQNNRIEFHYPETYQLSNDDDNLRKDILAILRTISLAKTHTRDLSSYNSEYHNENGFPMGAYLWIISDYLIYGKYENPEKIYLRGNVGRINWKRTMSSNPIASEGNIIYANTISERKRQADNVLTEIYLFCVQRAIESIGWLYGITFDPQGVDYYRLYNKKRYIGVLNTELLHTFDEKKRARLQNMKSVITGLDDSMVSTHDIIYGVDSYEYVYERMIDSAFSNVRSIKEFYPNAQWSLVVEEKAINSSYLRPDTVLIKGRRVYILDAKYYRYGSTFKPGDMPDTTSIQKQITYGEYVKKAKEGLYDEVFSAFVMPYSKKVNQYSHIFDKDMEFVGIGQASWVDSSGDNSRKIAAILIDTNFLISNWAKRNEDHVNQLISIIEAHIKSK